MSSVVPYHHPENSRLSITYTAYELEDAKSQVADLGEDILSKIEECELRETVYVVYMGEETPAVAEDIEYDLREEVSEMEWATQIITTRILGLFEAIAEEKYEEEEERLAAYKEIETDRIPEALDRVSWNGSVAEVGGELLSCLILRHALPNANHRTSLAMLSLYLQAISSGFEMPATATEEYDWEGWVNEYIEDSKRLITLRRNVPRFRYLNDAGCNVVERKDGLRIHLPEYDLSFNHWEALDEYGERHRERSIEFVENVLRQAGTVELRHGQPLSRSEFADCLQDMD